MTPEERRAYHYEAGCRRRLREGRVPRGEGRSRNGPCRAILGAEVASPRPEPETLLESFRRAAAPPRDLTGWYLGDPPVGYSALDQRNGVRSCDS